MNLHSELYPTLPDVMHLTVDSKAFNCDTLLGERERDGEIGQSQWCFLH